MLVQIGSFELEGLSYLRIGRYECCIGRDQCVTKRKWFWFFRDDDDRNKCLRAFLFGHEIVLCMVKPKTVTR